MPNTADDPSWQNLFAQFERKLDDSLQPEMRGLLRAEFSTTGPTERIAATVALMDAASKYFQFVMKCICGIPRLTLEGTEDDWQRLLEKVRALDTAPLELGWWTNALPPILEHFVKACHGEVDPLFWDDMVKQRLRYGGVDLNGWLIKLLPYVRSVRADKLIRNPVVLEEEGTITSENLTSGLSTADFLLSVEAGSVLVQAPHQFVSGFAGFETLGPEQALRPLIFWGMTEALPDQAAPSH